jgi:hypothetical protein
VTIQIQDNNNNLIPDDIEIPVGLMVILLPIIILLVVSRKMKKKKRDSEESKEPSSQELLQNPEPVNDLDSPPPFKEM